MLGEKNQYNKDMSELLLTYIYIHLNELGKVKSMERSGT